MDARNVVRFDRPRIPAGFRALGIVIVLGTIALVADHDFFIAPHAAHATAPTPVAASAQVDGFALPDHLKPTAADVDPPAPSF